MLKKINHNKLLIPTILLISITIVFSNKLFSNIGWDVFGYYLYLPSFLIYNDLGIDDITWVQQLVETYNNTASLYQFSQTPTNHNVIQYTMGMAFLYTPFFIVGHLYALVFNYPIDGLSLPYQIAFIIANFFYMALGLFFLRKTLNNYFKNKVTNITLLIIVLGTNYIHLNIWGIGNSHNYIFTLYAALFWFSIKWHQKSSIKTSIILGLILGLIILIRPSEIVCVLIPLFLGYKGLKERLSIIKKRKKEITLLMIIILLIGIPQLIYWKLFSGSFFYVSYQNAGEGLDFFSPHILDVLFSFRKGWLIYSPIMIFSIIGLYFLYQQKRTLFLPVFLFFIFNLLIVSSWSVWWYATSFSQRSLIQSYAVLAIPIAATINYLFTLKRIVKKSVFMLIILLVIFNIFQIWQYNKGILHGDRMTRAYYFSVFGQTTPPTKKQKELLLIERSLTAEDHFTHRENYQLTFTKLLDFEEGANHKTLNAHTGNNAFLMSKEKPFSPAIKIKYKELTSNDYAWLKVTLWVFPKENWKESKLSLITFFDHKKPYKYRGIDTEVVLDLIPNQWNKIEKIYLTPEVRSINDEFVAYAWLRGEQEILIDDLKVEVYNKKD